MPNTRLLAGKAVRSVGLGCMNLSHAYGMPPSENEAAALLLKAVDLGCDHFDTATLYGFGANETLVGKTLKPHRSRILLASKCGMGGVDGKRVIDGRPETLMRQAEASLQRLQTDVIDLYYLHRWDKNVPVEESVGALSRLVEQGKIRAVGLSEVSAATLEKAHAVHPIAAVQTEYSLWTRNPEIAVLQKTRELGAAFVAFSPSHAASWAVCAMLRRWKKKTSAAPCRVFPPKTTPPTCACSTRCKAWRHRRAAPPPNSVWHGCLPGPNTSCRFPAPHRRSTWPKTLPPPNWKSMPPSCNRQGS